MVIPYSDVRDQITAVLVRVCAFAGIDPTFYDSYDFKVFNKSQTMKSARFNRLYRDARGRLRQMVHDKPRVRGALRKARHQIEPVLLRANRASDSEIVIRSELAARLDAYYGDQPAAIAELLGLPTFKW
jgi:hypothetical protein